MGGGHLPPPQNPLNHYNITIRNFNYKKTIQTDILLPFLFHMSTIISKLLSVSLSLGKELSENASRTMWC